MPTADLLHCKGCKIKNVAHTKCCRCPRDQSHDCTDWLMFWLFTFSFLPLLHVRRFQTGTSCTGIRWGVFAMYGFQAAAVCLHVWTQSRRATVSSWKQPNSSLTNATLVGHTTHKLLMIYLFAESAINSTRALVCFRDVSTCGRYSHQQNVPFWDLLCLKFERRTAPETLQALGHQVEGVTLAMQTCCRKHARLSWKSQSHGAHVWPLVCHQAWKGDHNSRYQAYSTHHQCMLSLVCWSYFSADLQRVRSPSLHEVWPRPRVWLDKDYSKGRSVHRCVVTISMFQ